MNKRTITVLQAIVYLTIGMTLAFAAETNAPTAAPAVDKTAQKFMQSCRGCHTIGGGVLSGPDLAGSATWKKEDLLPAIKRMEKRVGPLTDDEVSALADLIRDEKATVRLKAAEEAVAKMFAAKLEPASAATGRELFFGRKAFINGGMACSSCHEVKGNGGVLGPDLTGVHAKMGETPLVSAIEKAGFKVMAAAYRTHPVTKQEAMHVSKFLASLASEPQITRPPIWPLGAAGAAVCFLGLMLWRRGPGNNRRPRLQRRRQ